jgi:hypothetical protein
VRYAREQALFHNYPENPLILKILIQTEGLNRLLHDLHQRDGLHDGAINHDFGKVGAASYAPPVNIEGMTAGSIGRIVWPMALHNSTVTRASAAIMKVREKASENGDG